MGLISSPLRGMIFPTMKLRAYRERKKLTVEAFAKRLDASRGAVLKWERGERTPSPEMMRRIFAETHGNVTPNDFLDMSADAA